MKSMAQTAFILQPPLLPQWRPPALEKQNFALPPRFSAFSSFAPCFSVVIAFLSGFGFCVWFAFGSCPLKRGPWVSWGLPVCFPVFPGEAGLTQLLWQPVFPRRAAKHVEEPLWGEPGQHLLMEKPFQGVSSEPLTRANQDRLWVYSPASRASGSIPSGSINSFLWKVISYNLFRANYAFLVAPPNLRYKNAHMDTSPLGLSLEAWINIMELPLPHGLHSGIPFGMDFN